MFDFRYHVASLAAVFIALVLGILAGIGLSGRGFVNDAERSVLQGQIDDLRVQRDSAVEALAIADRRGAALDDFAETVYSTLARGRLRDKRVAVLFAGSIDQGISTAITRAVRDAGGSITRVRAIEVPLDQAGIAAALSAPARRDYVTRGRWEALGRALGGEFVAGGQTPLWDALAEAMVKEQTGPGKPTVDAVVIARPARPQQGVSRDFLGGLYQGLASGDQTVVGVESAVAVTSAIPAFRRGGLSTVDSVESAAGRLATILLLAGGRPGSYGVEDTAADGVLPPVPAR
ncbi:MAG: copper transporter [Gaiellales bacterium]